MTIVKYRVTPEIGDHRPTITVEPAKSFGSSWQWSCSCGARGRRQHQSDSVSMFQWVTHAYRKMGWPVGRGALHPGYIWLNAEKKAKADA